MSDREYIDFKKLKARVSMRDIIDHYGLTEQMERKNEDTLVGPCPITGSDSPTVFKINESKDVWYSFALEGEGEGGNILEFVTYMEDTDLVGAANLIDDWFPAEAESDATEDAEDEGQATEAPDDRPDAYEVFQQLCTEEIDRIEDGARSAVAAALEDASQLDGDDREEVIDQVSQWVMRAYKRGYKLGKMQGRIDERVDRID